MRRASHKAYHGCGTRRPSLGKSRLRRRRRRSSRRIRACAAAVLRGETVLEVQLVGIPPKLPFVACLCQFLGTNFKKIQLSKLFVPKLKRANDAYAPLSKPANLTSGRPGLSLISRTSVFGGGEEGRVVSKKHVVTRFMIRCRKAASTAILLPLPRQSTQSVCCEQVQQKPGNR